MKKTFPVASSIIVAAIVITLISFISMLLLPELSEVFAREEPGSIKTAQASGGIGIRLVPARGETSKGFFYYELKPGQSKDNRIEVINNSDRPASIHIYPGDATNSESGALTGNTLGEPVKNAGLWVKVEKEKDTLPPKGIRTYRIDFKVPEDTLPGDYLAFVFVQPASDEQVNDVKSDNENQGKENKTSVALKVVQRYGIVLWARVPGEHTRSVEYSGLSKSFTSGRLLLVFDIINTGNLFIKPVVEWNLLNNEGETILASSSEDAGYLLPGSRNRISIPLVSNRPIARGEYILQVKMNDSNSDYKLDKGYKVTLP
jgi:hypothetical protein